MSLAEGARKTLITAATGEASEWLDIARPSFAAYAERHGYRFVAVEERLEAARPPAWDKVLLLKRELAQAELVVWVDADCVILDLEEDIADALPAESFLALRENVGSRGVVPNTGVLVMRSGEMSQRFLDETWTHTEHLHHLWWENAAMLEVFGFTHRVTDDLRVVECRPERPSVFYEQTAKLDLRWNSMFFAGCAEPAIRHLAGVYPRAIRSELMRKDADLFARRYHADGRRREGPWPAAYDWDAALHQAQARAEAQGVDAEATRLAWRRAETAPDHSL